MSDFIFELGCEELPSAAVWPLADELATHFIKELEKAQLSYGIVQRYATPRRLAFIVRELQQEQKSQVQTRRGPALAAAYDPQGNPTPALLGFAKSCGVCFEDLTVLKTEKGEWLVWECHSAGAPTVHLLPAMIQNALAALSITKPMRWGSGDFEFARPVHWALMLWDGKIVECDILGVKTNGFTHGHRFHHPQALAITSAESYEEQLKHAFVIVDFAQRRQLIEQQVSAIAHSLKAQAIMPSALVDEVTSIVEWPQALLAHFDTEFLRVPAEALIAAMQEHQKCFALKDAEGQLLPYFITVANISSSNPQHVIVGNEKVMRARLSDAAFFFNQDRKQRLEQHVETTKQVVFQAKLGSLFDKSQRIQALMHYLTSYYSLEGSAAQRAALLSKCDLLSGMVGEFPELQGLMGYYYALHDGEDGSVALALNEQYMPRFAADQLPSSALGTALSLADRCDTLVGIFAIGQKPSGVKDPFKLRRHALAVVRLLIATPASLSLTALLEHSLASYPAALSQEKTIIVELKNFILERLYAYYQNQAIDTDLVNAVRACQDEWLYDLDKRIQALKNFVQLQAAAALSAACKRVNNILASVDSTHIPKMIDEQLIGEGAESALYKQIKHFATYAKLYQTAQYDVLLQHLAALREPVDAFFDGVMVMVDDQEIKNNRLALLYQLQSLLQGVADISLLQLS